MSIELGSGGINKIYLGNTEIKKVYLGSDLIYDKTAAGGYLLDTYTNAAAAYSLRQLKTGVTNVVRVRRSSDNAEQDFTPTQITDGTLTTFTGAGDGFVSAWYDQSGNANNATQTTLTIQAKIVNSGALILDNGNPVADYGLDKAVSYTFNTRLTNVLSSFIVNKFIPATIPTSPVGAFLLGDSATADYTGDDNSATGRYIDLTFASSDVRDGDNYLNGTPVNLGLTSRKTTTSLVTMFPLGATNVSRISQDRGNVDRSWTGYIKEIILYESNQSANRAGVEANINGYYNIY